MSGKSGNGSGSTRALKVRVKTARRRTTSSTRWLQRQLNDPYVRRAKAEGYRSRAAYKLIEMDDKHHLLRAGMRVVDLGAAPGGWSQVCVERTGSDDAHPRIVAIDYLEMDQLPGVIVLQKNFLDDDAPAVLIEALGHRKADLVLSDMAAPTTGHKKTDHLRIMHLCEVAAEFARDILAPGGAFLAKVFRGGTENELLANLKRDFAQVMHVKPAASRSDSVELYVLAKGFRGRTEAADDDGEAAAGGEEEAGGYRP
ncbi:RlmE family RNA methyltransferase [Pseudoxanthobacter sp.]|uniref:RlmE family RNA methyltransferase n=1 Tax=Pseudoxanthobacter sp. TaxID=1925742 RepID=UPI002FE3F461